MIYIMIANFPGELVDGECKSMESGIYFGWASVGHSPTVYPMVMSLGWNPYYKNQRRSGEVHIIHQFPNDFYGEELRVIILGYIRPEKDYASLDDLIWDIKEDIRLGSEVLEQSPAYSKFRGDQFLMFDKTYVDRTTSLEP